ncbi:MAG: hypothetical protein KDB53_13735 [Planctomycetes bacterium]|nr:hypothetical protein [Planctomycetota bacterium]
MTPDEETQEITLAGGSYIPDTVCSETEFTGILAEQMNVLLHLAGLADREGGGRLSRRLQAAIHEEAGDIEELLEDYDARYNRTFAGLLELVASIHLLAAAGHTLKSIQMRSAGRGIPGQAEASEALRQESRDTLEFLEGIERALLDRLTQETRRVCGEMLSSEPPRGVITHDSLLQKRLPHTLGAEQHGDPGSIIAGEATLFVGALKTFNERFQCRKVSEPSELWRVYEEVCQEQQARFLEAKLQNIVSRYDTFIRNTEAEHQDENLRDFQHCVGMAKLFSRIVTPFIQMVNRFNDPSRSEEAKAHVSSLVPMESILERLVNYALYYVHAYLEVGEPIAKRLIQRYTTTETIELDLPEGCILHARPASMIAKIVGHHGTPVDMTIGSETCYAGSIMKVILLAGNNLHERRVTFKGDRSPIQDLKLLFENRLGEDGLEKLPDELAYLRR